jgi:flagellar protein FliT
MPHLSEKDMPAHDVLAAYERLAQVTSRMRVAAASQDWDTVMSLESECAVLYAGVLKPDGVRIEDSRYQQRKSELICKLLEDDADIRERISGELTRIWRLIHGRNRVEQLSTAYGAHNGASGSERLAD